jgi:3-oxoacyl-[acyl-carrier-protein] synthase II
MSRRVVITGAGVISPIGTGIEEFWRSCLAAKSVVAPVPDIWTRYANLHSRIWSPLPQFNAESFGVSRTEQLQLDPVTVLALGASHEALTRAGFTLAPVGSGSRAYVVPGLDATQVGVYFGTGIGGAHSFLHNHTYHLLKPTREALDNYAQAHAETDNQKLNHLRALLQHGRRYHPFVVSMLMPNAASAAVGIKFSLTGPNKTYCVACAAGTVAVGNGYEAVRDGRVTIAVTGGSEYLYDEHGHIFRGFDVAGTLVRDCADPATANRPFDQKRSGFLFSQGGAAVLVLEELEHARRRGATIMAEVIGYAETFDAYSVMSLAPGGVQIERMIRAALGDAGVEPSAVDYINAHATGTENNDKTEVEVIERVFGRRPLVNATKSLLGHAIGASGAIEALVTALTLREGTTHICKNLDSPVRDLNFVRDVQQADLGIGLSQSFAFGGHNAAVVLRRYSHA